MLQFEGEIEHGHDNQSTADAKQPCQQASGRAKTSIDQVCRNHFVAVIKQVDDLH